MVVFMVLRADSSISLLKSSNKLSKEIYHYFITLDLSFDVHN